MDHAVPDIAQLGRITATINLDHLRHNARILQQRAGHADLMAVVKADAYGHGAVRVVETLLDEGIRHFAVARVSEAIALREGGIDASILVMGAPLPGELPSYVEHNLDVTISSPDVARAVMEIALSARPLRVHVKVDTGMGRIGLSPEEAPPLVRALSDTPGVHLAGLWTHFATAGRPQDAFARTQLDRFKAVVREVRDTYSIDRIHAANSGALFTLEESVRAFDPTFVRVGITLYGLAGRTELIQQIGLRPVMHVTAPITHIKTVAPGTSISYGRRWRASRRTRIATVRAGYGDGYPRGASGQAEVSVHGRRYPVVGTICMDMFMIDLGPPGLSASDEVGVGDTVTLFGPEGPTAVDVAQWAGTIPYEICCRISARVPRYYRSEPIAR